MIIACLCSGLAGAVMELLLKGPSLPLPQRNLQVSFVSLLLAHGTHCHPFLLADNRHVTFYLWRHLLGRHLGARRGVDSSSGVLLQTGLLFIIIRYGYL